MQETWKDVAGFEGIYEVSNRGAVRSVDRITRCGKRASGKILSAKGNNRGYVQLHLYKGGECHMKLLHRVVAEAFIENPENLPQINHKDENKHNNHADNLEWCSNLYNRRYGTGYKRSCDKHDYKKIADMKKKTVIQKTLSGETIAIWNGVISIQSGLGINEGSIRACCYGKYKQAGGFVWEYA